MNKSESSTAEERRFLDAGELAPHFEKFASRLRERGYRSLSIEGYRGAVAHFGHWMSTVGVCVSDIDDAALARFAAHRCMCPGGRHSKSVSRRYVARVRRFVESLHERGVVHDLGRRSPPSLAIAHLSEFRNWLLHHRGLSERTVAGYEHWLRQLHGTLGENAAQYTAKHVREAVRKEVQHRSLSATKNMVAALRGYLRFLAAHDLCPPGLDAAVPSIPRWRLSTLPRYLDSNDVERVIDSCHVESPVGLRNRAILLFLARLGLRAGDIVAMRFNDIDWDGATLRVCGKSRREVRLPLPQDVGDALLEYLERGRPALSVERVFLCAQAPFRPFTATPVVSAIVSAALRRAGISDPPSRGTHLLRHSAATAMLRSGASLDAIASVLRHRSSDTTAHYAKVDLAMLAPLAQAWPEGVSC